VPSRDPADYARAVAGLIADRPRLARLARGAREHASRFGWSATVDGLMTLYSDVMSRTAAVDAAAIDA